MLPWGQSQLPSSSWEGSRSVPGLCLGFASVLSEDVWLRTLAESQGLLLLPHLAWCSSVVQGKQHVLSSRHLQVAGS